MELNQTQAAGCLHIRQVAFNAQFHSVFVANDEKPARKPTLRIYADCERIAGDTTRTDIPVRMMSEVIRER